jgi:hypothetical protein
MMGEVHRAIKGSWRFRPDRRLAVGNLWPRTSLDRSAPALPDLADYLDLSVAGAQEQFRELLARRAVPAGQRQVVFQPVETPSLARLFARPPSSVPAKMAPRADVGLRDAEPARNRRDERWGSPRGADRVVR